MYRSRKGTTRRGNALSGSGFRLLLFLLLVPSAWLQAAPALGGQTWSEFSLTLPGGEQLPVQRAASTGADLLIWLPSEFGLHSREKAPVAESLAGSGIEVWIPDLFSAYFVQKGRRSLDSFKAAELLALLRHGAEKKKKIYLMASSRGAKTALELARAWQLANPSQSRLQGLVLMSPSLYSVRPALGQEAEYLQVVYRTNLPVYLFQPEYSTAYFRVRGLLRAWGRGCGRGRVFLHTLSGIKDGFHVRPEADLGTADLKLRRRFPQLLLHAIRVLSRQKIPLSAVRTADRTVSATGRGALPGLQPYRSGRQPDLRLTDLDGRSVSLQDFRGRVVLVSFWAGWCPPCIREIPSLSRLARDYGQRGLVVLAVNIGETRRQVRAFLRRHRLNARILMDYDKRAYSDWKVYVVPSNYLVDKTGKIRYGSVGAIDWDAAAVRATIDRLVN